MEEKLNLILQELQHLNNRIGKLEDEQANTRDEVKHLLLNLQNDGELTYQKIALLELWLNRQQTNH